MPAHVPPVADERDGLMGFLAQQRQALRYAAYGLTDEEAARTPSASALSVAGVIKHVTSVERWWMSLVTATPVPQSEQSYLDGFRMVDGETLDLLLDEYATAARETEKAIAEVADLGRPVPVPRDAPWLPRDIDAWSVRWVLLHLIEETARHAGHADIVRESLDGAVAISLLAGAEGWPDDGWVKPWRRGARTEGER